MVSVMLYPCILCVAVLVLGVACLTVFVNCLGATISNMFGCGCYIVVECYG